MDGCPNPRDRSAGRQKTTNARRATEDDDGFSERDDGVGKRWRHVHGGWSGVLRHQRGEDLWRCVRLRTACMMRGE